MMIIPMIYFGREWKQRTTEACVVEKNAKQSVLLKVNLLHMF